MLSEAEKVKKIAKVLKIRFTNLSVEETIDIAYKILESLEEPK